MVGADRSDCFKHFIEGIREIIGGWKEKYLSLGGKEILIKDVAQFITVYAMPVFKLPKGVCKEIMNTIAGFWWGDNGEDKKMHWWAWWKLCFPKNEGGMGFRDLHSFNLAMLAKQAWRLITYPDLLCAQVLRAKYHPDGNVLKAGPKGDLLLRGKAFGLGSKCLFFPCESHASITSLGSCRFLCRDG